MSDFFTPQTFEIMTWVIPVVAVVFLSPRMAKFIRALINALRGNTTG